MASNESKRPLSNGSAAKLIRLDANSAMNESRGERVRYEAEDSAHQYVRSLVGGSIDRARLRPNNLVSQSLS